MKANYKPGRLLSMTDHELYVLTAAHEGQRSGMIVSWLMPGTLVMSKQRVVCVLSVHNFTYELICNSRTFVAQMLSTDQIDLVPHFGAESGRDRDKFAGIDTVADPSGALRLQGTCGWMRCSVTHTLELGDRTIVVADIEEQMVDEQKRPLHKKDALARLPAKTCAILAKKMIVDGVRDAALIR